MVDLHPRITRRVSRKNRRRQRTTLSLLLRKRKQRTKRDRKPEKMMMIGKLTLKIMKKRYLR